MIASFKDEDEIVTRWRWHYWQVPPEDASTILSKELEEGSPVVERAYSAYHFSISELAMILVEVLSQHYMTPDELPCFGIGLLRTSGYDNERSVC